ncbi:MAG TPA: alcohol dehydrogenase catalytic domain-containing protein [Paraburkholderia sp.]|jgi:(R,R)-butanediol dehydrogenase/meso-butanediol dehydrogenase/diacetyl reductase|nr:alcohol dehydrogenase catalytic domain-containing protein [Paraburkholderia sp.]
MKALQFLEVGRPLQLTDMERPAAPPGGLVFKVKACGICTSDLHAVEVPGLLQPGNVLGHEYSGVVVEVGPGTTGWRVGERLVALPAKPCGTCPACAAGRNSECAQVVMQGFDLRMPGGYAEYATCMAALAMKIPDNLSDTDAATIEPLAVGLGAWKAANVPPGADVLVVGAGIIGLAVAKWARFFGAGHIGISEIVPARRARAQKVGAGVVIDAAQASDPVAEFERQTGRKPSVIFECVGRPMIAQLIGFAPTGAHLVMVGTGMQPENFTVVSAALKRLRMTFPLAYDIADFPFVQRMLAAGRITVDGLVTATVSLAEAPAMFERLGKPNDHCKVLIVP